MMITATFAALELRVPDTDERLIEGIVVPYGETSFMTPDPRGERFMPGSLTRTVKERGQMIKLYRTHDHNVAVGRPVAWNTKHEGGCWAQFRIANTPAGDAVLNEAREGMLDAFSVGFLPKRQVRGADGAREVIEAQLHEVSLVPMGAYDGARVLAMRSSGSDGPTGASAATLPPMPTVNLSPLVLPSRW
jgi:HK97 family phage prohead protease